MVSAYLIGDGGPLAYVWIVGKKVGVVEVEIEHGELPNFRSRSGGEILRVAIIHYEAIAVNRSQCA